MMPSPVSGSLTISRPVGSKHCISISGQWDAEISGQTASKSPGSAAIVELADAKQVLGTKNRLGQPSHANAFSPDKPVGSAKRSLRTQQLPERMPTDADETRGSRSVRVGPPSESGSFGMNPAAADISKQTNVQDGIKRIDSTRKGKNTSKGKRDNNTECSTNENDTNDHELIYAFPCSEQHKQRSRRDLLDPKNKKGGRQFLAFTSINENNCKNSFELSEQLYAGMSSAAACIVLELPSASCNLETFSFRERFGHQRTKVSGSSRRNPSSALTIDPSLIKQFNEWNDECSQSFYRFKPVYTHQFFTGEKIVGYQPNVNAINEVQSVFEELYDDIPIAELEKRLSGVLKGSGIAAAGNGRNTGPAYHSSFLNHCSAKKSLSIQIRLAPSCRKCALVIKVEKVQKDRGTQQQRQRSESYHRSEDEERSNKPKRKAAAAAAFALKKMSSATSEEESSESDESVGDVPDVECSDDRSNIDSGEDEDSFGDDSYSKMPSNEKKCKNTRITGKTPLQAKSFQKNTATSGNRRSSSRIAQIQQQKASVDTDVSEGRGSDNNADDGNIARNEKGSSQLRRSKRVIYHKSYVESEDEPSECSSSSEESENESPLERRNEGSRHFMKSEDSDLRDRPRRRQRSSPTARKSEDMHNNSGEEETIINLRKMSKRAKQSMGDSDDESSSEKVARGARRSRRRCVQHRPSQLYVEVDSGAESESDSRSFSSELDRDEVSEQSSDSSDDDCSKGCQKRSHRASHSVSSSSSSIYSSLQESTEEEIKIEAIVKQLSRGLPEITEVVVLDGTTCKVNGRDVDTTAFSSTIESIDEIKSDYLDKPIGTILQEYTKNKKKMSLQGSGGVANGCLNSECTDVEGNFVLCVADMRSDPNGRSYHDQVEKLAPWFIEVADCVEMGLNGGIGIHNGHWKVMYLFEKHHKCDTRKTSRSSISKENRLSPSNDADARLCQKFSLAGYMTFFFHPKQNQETKMIVCQALLLPPYQKSGHGTIMLRAAYDIAYGKCSLQLPPKMKRQEFITEIDVESPAPAFVALRNRIDYGLFQTYQTQAYSLVPRLCTPPIQVDSRGDVCEQATFGPLSESILEKVASTLKITPRQVQICHEIWQLGELEKMIESFAKSLVSTTMVNKFIVSTETSYKVMVKRSLLKALRENQKRLIFNSLAREDQKEHLESCFQRTIVHYRSIVAK